MYPGSLEIEDGAVSSFINARLVCSEIAVR